MLKRVVPRPARALRARYVRHRRQRAQLAAVRARYLSIGRTAADLAAYLAAIESYWRSHYGCAVDPTQHLEFAAVTGIDEPRVIPRAIWHKELIPRFNDQTITPAYGDKNLTDLLLDCPSAPSTVLKRIRGRYYAERPLDSAEAFSALISTDRSLIAKPSRTDNGVGITPLCVTDGTLLTSGGLPTHLTALETQLGNDFLVQQRLDQHPHLASVHPYSVNTLRIATMRWDGVISHLGTFARFGTGGAPNDNAGTGGLVVGIDDAGGPNASHAVDEHGSLYACHPTTGFVFADFQVPNWRAMRSFAVDLHRQVPHLDLISWDVAVSPNAQPILIEMNFKGAVRLYQWALRRGVFGEATGAVLTRLRTA